ncbi:efflux transporter outer membrane subunit [Govanella unica]|uniref:Efflux transporter outer membrane subunit n=1 Tax=Govanella unica TaxID=2975056 RepID=A0A9X3TY84_9PROT|nr:efflux transporter outer membrane subunit [Govania unica]MDA5194006.1 efflux transporter outer membrane subunit [Govania unica]
MPRFIHALPFIAMLSACNLAPDYQRPDVNAGEGWRDQATMINQTSAARMNDPVWWEQFGSPELSTLIASALAHNTDLEVAIQRVEQARAALGMAGADRLPTLSASGNVAKDWDRAFQSGTRASDGYRGQATLSYEVDLFGRVANNVKSASLRADAAGYSRDALALVLEAQVVQAYGQILAYNDRMRITRDRLSTAEDIYRIVEARFREGSASGLELAQQRTELANFQATLATLEQSRSIAINQLAVLTGKAPQLFAEPTATLSTLMVPAVVALPPSDLLARRPDIAQSEARLAAANADIGVARAAYFPTLRLGGDAGLSANPISAAVTTVAGVAGSLTAPIFDGGRISAGVQNSKAVRDELVANYRGTVLTAFQEAEDALAALTGTEKRLAAYTVAAEQARIAYNLSRERFDAGSIDFLTLLDAQRSLLQAEENLAQSRYDRVAAASQLFKAMGGGWMN